MKKPGKSRGKAGRHRGGRSKGVGAQVRTAKGPASATSANGSHHDFAGLSRHLTRVMAIELRLSGYSQEDRRALSLLLLPFLILTTALAINHGWRTTRAALHEITAPFPYRNGPWMGSRSEVAETPAAPARFTEADAPRAAVQLPALPDALAPPKVGVDRPGTSVAREAPSSDQRLALHSQNSLTWPPPGPRLPSAEGGRAEPGGEVCLPASPARLVTWSARKSQAVLGKPAQPGSDFGVRLAEAARSQTQDLVIYSARYQSIAYPRGDLPAMYGACTDVLIRAYRALGIDLQELVKRARVGSGDTSIDHRRTETLRRFFARQGISLPVSEFPEDYKPGDIVTYHRPFSRVSGSHIAVVSDVLAPTGRPMIVHNRGWGPQLEDALFVDQITGHYRFAPVPARVEPEAAEAEGGSQHHQAARRGGKLREVAGLPQHTR